MLLRNACACLFNLPVNIEWKEAIDANGLRFEFTVATIEIEDGNDLLIEIVDQERAEQIDGYRKDKRFRPIFSREGSKGQGNRI